MRWLWLAGLLSVTACGKLVSIPGVNAKVQSQDSVGARLTVSTDSATNVVNLQIRLLGKVYRQTCFEYFPSLTFHDKGTDISTAYIDDRRPGYFFQGKFVPPYIAPFYGEGCDVVMCEALNKSEITLQQSLVFLKEDPPRPVPADYAAQLETIRNKVDAATYQELASLKELKAYSEVIYRGSYTFGVGGFFKDASCETPLRAAINFVY